MAPQRLMSRTPSWSAVGKRRKLRRRCFASRKKSLKLGALLVKSRPGQSVRRKLGVWQRKRLRPLRLPVNGQRKKLDAFLRLPELPANWSRLKSGRLKSPRLRHPRLLRHRLQLLPQRPLRRRPSLPSGSSRPLMWSTRKSSVPWSWPSGARLRRKRLLPSGR